jgi:hypothetical protein
LPASREDEALDRRIRQDFVEGSGRDAVLIRDAGGRFRVAIHHRRERAELGMVASVVPAPDADADHGDLRGVILFHREASVSAGIVPACVVARDVGQRDIAGKSAGRVRPPTMHDTACHR